MIHCKGQQNMSQFLAFLIGLYHHTMSICPWFLITYIRKAFSIQDSQVLVALLSSFIHYSLNCYFKQACYTFIC